MSFEGGGFFPSLCRCGNGEEQASLRTTADKHTLSLRTVFSSTYGTIQPGPHTKADSGIRRWSMMDIGMCICMGRRSIRRRDEGVFPFWPFSISRRADLKS